MHHAMAGERAPGHPDAARQFFDIRHDSIL
jgi:hypothetical protein